VASGFLSPATNQNGAAFGLLAVLADGTAFMLGNVTGIEENSNNSNFNIYPNPAFDAVNIQFADSDVNEKEITITDMTGREVRKVNKKYAGEKINVNISSLKKGIYMFNVSSNNKTSSQKLIIQ